ncbi:putative iron-only hydrogenase system regulator [Peptoniphilus duerdenii ATCC BAA-1640]|uniref:Putative iron-only hydrogenase system regulator n=1 Tax=Peptoniphilus duerdenii ATCC BAA-1640 TaxID=862517 RepID=E0NJJ3_9FIRM|nr:TM1266 family iron-only hydrogenase system putative regulator [Peptoniphilus duerdenii]EFM26013.1 putative iron-only hydrogenase system regulator [Peptoniphilus duerdenii ATCC BAA-1640]
MKNVAIMAIIVENRDSVEKINSILHEYREFIIGRMGLPYNEKNISIISIILDAPKDKIDELSAKIGEIQHVKSNTLY